MRHPARPLTIASILSLLIPSLAPAAKPDLATATERPDPATVERFGPAYRYPRAGWIVLHIEGAPYERGYQHGRLLARELAEYVRTLATQRSRKDPNGAWRETRTMVNALFLRRYDKEYLEEMKGIADGAAAAGATFSGRPLDFLDVVTVNSDVELEFLDSALEATPTGLEAKTFREPPDLAPSPSPPEHCSAFAAVGPATADGKIVLGHITMFNIVFVRYFNIRLDVKPEDGHRVMMQTYPGGIQSGMDYYLNDAGMIVTETTIKQTKFDIEGRALASRIRKALQYADSIDKSVEILRSGNNGMYTNEWLLADTKTNEIAMFELGTHRNKLWRSSKDEWFGGTEGFYWGCNNAKDLDVRLETVASLDGRPANPVFHPSDRDRTWLKLYDKHKGSIAAGFGFEAFTTPPLSAFPSLDAKFTTSALAKDLKTWALFGPPMGRTWEPTAFDRGRVPEVQPLISNDWTLLTADAPPSPGPGALAVDLVKSSALTPSHLASDRELMNHPPAWRGTILPKTDADIWLAAAFADYERIVAREIATRRKLKGKPLDHDQQDELDVALFAPYSRYRTAVIRLGRDIPLAETRSDLQSDDWYQIAAGKGVLLFSALRQKLGDEAFLKLMRAFGPSHAGKPTSVDDFRGAAEAVPDHDLKSFFTTWLTETGLPSGKPRGAAWSIDSFETELDQSIIVYGTVKESDAQHEAAERLQQQVRRKWANITVPIVSDRDADAKTLAHRHILLVGRPGTNALASTLVKNLPVTFGPASFTVKDKTYGHALSAIIAAGPNPDDPRHEVIIFAGLSAEATWKCVQPMGERDSPPTPVLLLPAHESPRRLVSGRPEPPARSAAR